MRASLAPALFLPLMLVACANDIKVSDSPNQAPTAVINAPTNGDVYLENEVIAFQGVVADSDGLTDIATLTWVSNIDGEFADFTLAQPDGQGVSRASSILSVGVHAITLRVTDTAGQIGEDSIQVSVGVGNTLPTAIIVEPVNFAEVYPGLDVDLRGSVSDPNDDVQDLAVQWTVTRNGETTPVYEGPIHAPDATGGTVDTWTPAATGNFLVALIASDPEGNTVDTDVFVVVVDPGDADLDGDGYSPNSGDCNDNNYDINPGVIEICGNALDDDCTADPTAVPPYDGIDDKDEDGDDHIDEACVNYTYGDRPVDDCDDTDNQTFPGAYEAQDGIDNDCDGAIDNGGGNYDDDGDCYCEVGPCAGSSNGACGTLLDGDCDDLDDQVNPGMPDRPELSYTDDNCDGIDGDITNSIFLDPVNGSNANDGLTQGTAVANLDTAYTQAAVHSKGWILISSGAVGLSGDFRQARNLAGGYNAAAGWSRSGLSTPTIALPSGGKWLSNWNTPTEWQQLDISAAPTAASNASSVALWVENTTALTLRECVISSDNAGPGTAGSQPTPTGSGNNGSNGADGCEEGGCCGDWICLCSCCNRPPAPSGGTGCGGLGNGGAGGRPGIDGGSGNTGSGGNAVGAASGGNGGAGGNNNGDQGASGLAGTWGTPGSNGLAGANIGTFSIGGYSSAAGGTGGQGSVGAGGGGGGGGAGGGWTNGNCDTWGGAGGGGGGGGCGGNGGTGGTGGGASVAIVLVSGSSLTMDGGRIFTGNGGSGGTGGNGGNGGSGGNGGQGGDGETSIISEQSGPGGQGGQGGNGGAGGHGGGGGGGPSIGIVCRSSTLSQSGVTYTLGNGGAGGSSLGAAGNSGRQSQTDGC